MLRALLPLLVSCVLPFACVGCDGIFPAQTKVGIQADHTVNYGGAMHKQGAEHPFEGEGGCSDSDCHKEDLRGGLADVDGRQAIAPSCYQCHNRRWDDEDGDDSDAFLSSVPVALQPVHTPYPLTR